MISPRGLLGTLQEVSGDIAGASAMHTHPLFAETLSCDDDYEDDERYDDCDYFHIHCAQINYLLPPFFTVFMTLQFQNHQEQSIKNFGKSVRGGL